MMFFIAWTRNRDDIALNRDRHIWMERAGQLPFRPFDRNRVAVDRNGDTGRNFNWFFCRHVTCQKHLHS